MRKVALVFVGVSSCGGSPTAQAPSVAAPPVETSDATAPVALRTGYFGTVTIGRGVLLGHAYSGAEPPETWHYRVELKGDQVQRYQRVSPRGRVTRTILVENEGQQLTLRTLDSYQRAHHQRETRADLVAWRRRDGQRTLFGCAASREVYDERGRPVEVTCLDARGQVRVDDHGCARERRSYDDENALVRTACLDEAGRPIDDNDFIHERRFTYGDGGEILLETFRSLGTRPPGCARLAFEYDSKLQRTAERCEALDGSPRPYLDGAEAVSVEFEYDENDCLRRSEPVDANGRAALRKGISALHYVRDAHCEIRAMSSHGLDGQLIQRSVGGPALVTFVHDLFGQAIEQRCFDTERQPAPCGPVGGIASVVRFTHDRRGRVVARSAFDATGQPVRFAQHVPHRTTTVYDADARPTTREFFDARGQPSTASGGVHRLEYEYDAMGQLVLQSNRDESGQLVRPTTECAQIRYERDEQLRLARVLCLGTDGKPRPSHVVLTGVYLKEAAEVLVVHEDGRTTNVLRRVDGTVIDTIDCNLDRCLK